MDFTIVGGSIACLVAASEAAAQGARVRLIAPRRGLGSGFASVDASGRAVDLGARLIEVAAESSPTWSDWTPGEARRLSGHVRSYVEGLLGAPLVELAQAKVSVDGRHADDFLATLDLSSLPRLVSPFELEAMHRETADVTWSPSGTLEAASLTSHGPTFHTRFVASRAEKLYPGRWRHVGADVRHRLWAPLFHPKTLRAGLEGRIDRGREPVRYFAPASGVFGPVVKRLLARIDRGGVETVLYDRLDGLDGDQLVVDGAPIPIAGDLALGVSFAELARLAGHDEHVDEMALDVAWLEVAADDLLVDAAYVNVMDAANPAYRVSFGGRAPVGRRVVCVELAAGGAGRAVDAVTTAGIVREGASVALLRSASNVRVSAPTDKNRWLVTRAKVALPPARYLGSVRDLRADTFAEHVLQGLAFGASAMRRAA